MAMRNITLVSSSWTGASGSSNASCRGPKFKIQNSAMGFSLRGASARNYPTTSRCSSPHVLLAPLIFLFANVTRCRTRVKLKIDSRDNERTAVPRMYTLLDGSTSVCSASLGSRSPRWSSWCPRNLLAAKLVHGFESRQECFFSHFRSWRSKAVKS